MPFVLHERSERLFLRVRVDQKVVDRSSHFTVHNEFLFLHELGVLILLQADLNLLNLILITSRNELLFARLLVVQVMVVFESLLLPLQVQ